MTQSRIWRQFRVGMIAADALAIFLTYVVADILRCRLHMGVDWPELLPGKISSVREVHLKVLALLPFGWPLILSLLGWYQQRWRPVGWLLRTVLIADAILALFMAGLALLFVRELYPRAQIGFMLLLTPATTLAVRGITGIAGRWISSRQRRHVLVVGTGRDAVRLRRLLRTAALGKPMVLGHLRGFWEQSGTEAQTGAVLGEISQLGPILDGNVVDEVVFCAPLDALPSLMPYVQLCEEIGVVSQIQVESLTCHSQPELVNFHGIPLLSYSPVRHAPELLSIKRAVDVALALVGVLITAPIMTLCALAVKLTSPGPIIFRQRRSGLNGREFEMFKFRTMEAGAEARQAELAEMNEVTGPVFKIERDPRVTAVGRFLRRWSLDELPQLFNVLKGDMSIVGPRPPLPAEVARYDRWQRRRLSMRPGLTCLWQVKGRHKIGFDEWMKLDLFYIDHWSLKLDFLILCRTIAAVLSGSGA
ncbi:MAG: sugar transferase [Planctomycetota bacterium]|nr:MAG: sugar transferase [Planctomycetota bacterium]